MDISKLTPPELLQLHAKVAAELRARGITRTLNNPTGDLAEWLFCQAFGWKQATNSNPNIDAIGRDGTKYQIKARRITQNKSRQLGAIRDFSGRHFDYLAVVLFTETYEVFRAALIPYSVVEERARFISHTNSHKFLLRDEVWKSQGVRDVTAELKAVQL